MASWSNSVASRVGQFGYDAVGTQYANPVADSSCGAPPFFRRDPSAGVKHTSEVTIAETSKKILRAIDELKKFLVFFRPDAQRTDLLAIALAWARYGCKQLFEPNRCVEFRQGVQIALVGLM